MLGDAVKQFLKIVHIHIFHIVVGAKLGFDCIEACPSHLPLIQALHRVVTSHPASSRGRTFFFRCCRCCRATLWIVHENHLIKNLLKTAEVCHSGGAKAPPATSIKYGLNTTE